MGDTVDNVSATIEKAKSTASLAYSSAKSAYDALERPVISERTVQINEFFWCNFSMVLNVTMSLMLETCMFLKVATYTGRIAGVAITAVSLYFIFDLDDAQSALCGNFVKFSARQVRVFWFRSLYGSPIL